MRRGSGAIVLALALPLVAAVADPFGWYPFGPSKWIVISVLLPAGLAWLWWARPLVALPRPTAAVAALVAWFGVSAVTGADHLYAWIGTPERRLGVLTWILVLALFVAGQSLDPDRDRPALTWSVIAAGLLAGGLATAEALGWEPDVFAVTPGRLTGSMGSAAYLGALSAVLLPALAGIVLDVPADGRARVRSAPWLAGVVATALTVVACIGSGARAAWLGLAVAAAVVVVARRRTLFADRRRAAIVGLGLAVGLIALGVLTPLGGRLAQATDPDAAGGRSRVDEWRVALSVVARHPLTGVGPEGYRIAFAEGVTDAYEEAYGRDPIPDRAHTAPLDIALAGGLPALAAWAIAVGWTLRACYRIIRRADAHHRWLAGLAAAVIAHVAGALLLFPTAELEPLVWMIGGVLVVADARRADVETGDTRSFLVPRAVPVAIGVLAAVAAVAGVRDVRADHQAQLATERARTGDTAAALDAVDAAIAQRPDELRLHLLRAQLLVAADLGTAPALRAVDDALALSPGDPIAQRHRARLLVQRAGATHLPDDVGRARRYLDELRTHDGSNASLELLAGSAARLAGDAAAAEAAFGRAERLAPTDPEPSIELSRLFIDTGRVADARSAAARAVARAPQDRRALDAQRLAAEAS